MDSSLGFLEFFAHFGLLFEFFQDIGLVVVVGSVFLQHVFGDLDVLLAVRVPNSEGFSIVFVFDSAPFQVILRFQTSQLKLLFQNLPLNPGVDTTFVKLDLMTLRNVHH